MDRRVVTIALVVAAVALSATSVADAARVHAFRAKYTGTGSGQATARGASGHASGSGTGNVIGPSRFSGAATAVVQSQSCVVFNGKLTMKGRGGRIVLSAHGGHACTSGPTGANVAFSGTATVTDGTGRFAGARGTLSFTGSYVKETGSVTISFKGRVSY